MFANLRSSHGELCQNPNRTVSAIPHSSATLPQPTERLQETSWVALHSGPLCFDQHFAVLLKQFHTQLPCRLHSGMDYVTPLPTSNETRPACNLPLFRSAGSPLGCIHHPVWAARSTSLATKPDSIDGLLMSMDRRGAVCRATSSDCRGCARPDGGASGPRFCGADRYDRLRSGGL